MNKFKTEESLELDTDWSPKSRLQWAVIGCFGAIAALLLVSACSSNRPTDDEVRASIYQLYHVNPSSINDTGSNGLTPLYEAVKFNDEDAVKLFLDDPDINIYTKPSALLRAAYNGSDRIVKMLVDRGARVDEKNKNGETALMIATRKEHSKVVRVLLKAGAKPNSKDKMGSTPIMKASLKGNIEIVNSLIAAGADLNETNRFGRNALIYAIAKDRSELAKGLIQPGVDVNSTDKKGQSPLFYAAQNGNLSILKKLIQNGAEVDLNKKEKRTLEVAANKGHSEIVQSLIQAQKSNQKRVRN